MFIKHDASGKILVAGSIEFIGNDVINVETVPDDFNATFSIGKYIISNGQLITPTGWIMPKVPGINIPYQPTLDEVKAAKELIIRAKGSSLMLQIVTPYSAEERDTWPSQVAEAKAYTENPAVATPMLTALCAQRGNTVTDQATRILANEAIFKTAVGTILGIQQAKIDLIAAATTAEQVELIIW